MTARTRGVAPWIAVAAVLLVALVIGARHPGPAVSPAQRSAAIDAVLRCPSCEDVSVAQSSAPAALAIRHIVAQRVAAGQSDATIEAYLVSRYGQGILLRPPTSGGTSVLWVVPVVAVAAGIGVFGVFFWRRRRLEVTEASVEDHVLVQDALAARGTP
jgi:cytochrome c-type biogenesis protein CcmH